MADEQDVPTQLLKPPRELASWKFPLAEVIGEYFDNLPHSTKVNYGQAALIIQNSANAYARKVEDLYDITQTFRLKVAKESEENEERLQQQQKEKRVKKMFDFSQFELQDFSKDVGKNINLKGNEMKPIKFLHHCFSQLENPRSKIKIEIKDIEGEAIGKKYDFRCNQHITKSGMLVEEFSPRDFEEKVASSFVKPKISTEAANRVSRHRSSSDSSGSNDVIITQIDDHPEQNIIIYDVENSEVFDDAVSGGCASPSVHDSGYSSTNHVESPFTDLESIASKTPKRPDFCGRDVPPIFDKSDASCYDSAIDNDTGIESCSDMGSPEQPFAGKVNFEPNYSSMNEMEKVLESSSEITSMLDITLKPEDTCKEVDELMDSSPRDGVTESDSESPVEQLIESEATTFIESIIDSESITDANQNEEIVESPNKRKSMESKETTLECGVRRSKRLKVVLDKSLKPIPFEGGIPDKIEVKGRKEFRLPCNIELLRNVPKKRKSKSSPPKRCKSPKKTKETKKKSLVMSLEEEVAELEKSLIDESISTTLTLAANYEPVTTVSMDLLGFAPSISKTDHVAGDDDYDECRSPTPCGHYATPCASPPRTPTRQLITPSKIKISSSMKKSGEMKERFQQMNFDTVLKHKIKSIKEELNLITDEDQKVAKWHEEIKPRLKEAERKPPFQIREYEDKIIQKLHSRTGRRLSFDDIVDEQPEGEVARYFSATLHLASSQNVDINTTKDSDASIEVILLD